MRPRSGKRSVADSGLASRMRRFGKSLFPRADQRAVRSAIVAGQRAGALWRQRRRARRASAHKGSSWVRPGRSVGRPTACRGCARWSGWGRDWQEAGGLPAMDGLDPVCGRQQSPARRLLACRSELNVITPGAARPRRPASRVRAASAGTAGLKRWQALAGFRSPQTHAAIASATGLQPLSIVNDFSFPPGGALLAFPRGRVLG